MAAENVVATPRHSHLLVSGDGDGHTQRQLQGVPNAQTTVEMIFD